MTILINSAEGGTNNAAVTTGNSGGTSGTAFAAVSSTLKFKNDIVAFGTLAYGWDSAGGVDGVIRWGLGDTEKKSNFRFYFYYSQALADQTNSFRITGNADAAGVLTGYFLADGRFRVGKTSSITNYTSTATLQTGAWYYLDGWVNTGTSATDGTARVQLVKMSDSSVLLDTGTMTGDFGAGVNLTNFRGFKTGTDNYPGLIRWDALEVRTGSDASSSFIGPYVAGANAAPTAAAGTSQIVSTGTEITLNGTASDPDGTVASAQWTCTSYPGGSAPTISNATALTGAKATLADPGVYVFRLVATDNQGSASSPATVTEYVYPASGTAVKVQSVTAGAWGTYGSPSSALVGLNDGLATTGMESPSGPTGQPLTVTFAPAGPGTIVLDVPGYSSGGAISRKIDIYKADGTTKIYDDPAFTLPTSNASHLITPDAIALAAIPAGTDRTALVAIVKDTAA